MMCEMMGVEGINNNTNMIKMWIDNEKAAEEQYYKDNTDSLIPLFENELRDLGFESKDFKRKF